KTFSQQSCGASKCSFQFTDHLTVPKCDLIIQVNVNDYLDIYCPHYNVSQRGTLERTMAEQYILYMVTYRGYRTCDPQLGFKRWECNRPHAPHAPIKFSEKFQRYSAFSLGYEFNVGQEYYYICESMYILLLHRTKDGKEKKLTQQQDPALPLLPLCHCPSLCDPAFLSISTPPSFFLTVGLFFSLSGSSMPAAPYSVCVIFTLVACSLPCRPLIREPCAESLPLSSNLVSTNTSHTQASVSPCVHNTTTPPPPSQCHG
uniref:Ephrin RBD domain-containing protein n=1 Tax=Anabas testudineus TaxID=64144 RepID=A0A7N6AXY7_ANATE